MLLAIKSPFETLNFLSFKYFRVYIISRFLELQPKKTTGNLLLLHFELFSDFFCL